MLSYERCIVQYLEDKQTCAWDSDQQQKYKFNLIGEQVSYNTLQVQSPGVILRKALQETEIAELTVTTN